MDECSAPRGPTPSLKSESVRGGMMMTNGPLDHTRWVGFGVVSYKHLRKCSSGAPLQDLDGVFGRDGHVPISRLRGAELVQILSITLGSIPYGYLGIDNQHDE